MPDIMIDNIPVSCSSCSPAEFHLSGQRQSPRPRPYHSLLFGRYFRRAGFSQHGFRAGGDISVSARGDAAGLLSALVRSRSGLSPALIGPRQQQPQPTNHRARVGAELLTAAKREQKTNREEAGEREVTLRLMRSFP